MSGVIAVCSPGQAADTVDPAIDRALSAYPTETAWRAAVSIRRSLAAALASRAGTGFRSRLTGDGFPLELAFSTADGELLRFTADPRSSLSGIRELLDQCDALEGEDVWDALHEMQRGGSLSFGAWVGGRVSRTSITHKVYVEVPDGVGMPACCPAAPVLPDRPVVPRMVGYTPATAALESYFRVPSLEPEHLVGLLAPARMHARVRPLLDFIEHAYGYRLRGRLPGPSVGVSYLHGPNGIRVTLHFYARSIWGSDARIRQGFARLGVSCGWDAETYLRVTEPVASRESANTHHGLLGFTLDESVEGIALSVGIRPVAA